jgi:hypothetical protein
LAGAAGAARFSVLPEAQYFVTRAEEAPLFPMEAHFWAIGLAELEDEPARMKANSAALKANFTW